MKINGSLFQATSTIYQTIIAKPTTQMAHSPEHAMRAARIAKMLFDRCNGDPVFTIGSARALAGFLVNPFSQHAPDQELVNLALGGANQLVQALSMMTVQPIEVPKVAPPPANNHPPQEMPPQGVGQSASPGTLPELGNGLPALPPEAEMPVLPNVPDFS